MLDANCDFYYIVYASIRGWSVRLNKKEKEKINKPLYKNIKRIGYGKINPDLLNLVNLHIKLMTIFQNEKCCKIK